MLITNDFDAQAELQPELLPDEKLLWSGKPAGGIKLRAGDALLIPFSIFWFGFAIFGEFTATMSGGGFFFYIMGYPFYLCWILYHDRQIFL